MSSPISEDVYSDIIKAVMTFPKGAQGEERESLRKLRDSTLLSLSMTSREISSVSLPALYRHVAVTPFNSRLLLPRTRDIHELLIHTRSLTLGISNSAVELTNEMQYKFFQNENAASHPEVMKFQEEIVKIEEENSKAFEQNKSLPDALKKRITGLQTCRSASILSIIIENMPNLQFLESSVWALFYFAKIHNNPDTRARSSRPLSGLLNLRILKIARSSGLHDLFATNCLWLMLFLPSLTHLKSFITLSPKDVKFFEDHQEVLVGKSKVTHLEIEFNVLKEQDRSLLRMTCTKNEALKSLLMVTKDLVELKLHHLLPSPKRINSISSLPFLKCLKSSSKTLKCLTLVGYFGPQPEFLLGSARLDSQEPLSITFDALELISLDHLSLKALRQLMFSSSELQLPSLNTSHMTSDYKHREDANSLIYAEHELMDWINSDRFPTTMKKIFLEEKLLDVDGKVLHFKKKKEEGEEARGVLIDLCRKKGLEVIVLKEGEQLPFGVMPEPEDLL